MTWKTLRKCELDGGQRELMKSKLSSSPRLFPTQQMLGELRRFAGNFPWIWGWMVRVLWFDFEACHRQKSKYWWRIILFNTFRLPKIHEKLMLPELFHKKNSCHIIHTSPFNWGYLGWKSCDLPKETCDHRSALGAPGGSGLRGRPRAKKAHGRRCGRRFSGVFIV